MNDFLYPYCQEKLESPELSGSLPFSEALSLLAAEVPEIAENYERIAANGQEIIETLTIQDSLFKDPSATLMLAAIADYQATLKQHATTQSESYKSATQFVVDAASLLANEHTGSGEPFVEEPCSASERYQAYEDFTHEEMTANLHHAIHGGLLNPIREAMGLSESNEAPFELRVLDISGYDAYGEGAKDGPLQQNARRLHQKIGFLDAGAWVEPDMEPPLMLIELPKVQWILHQEPSLLFHEYAHTQGSLLLGVGLGNLLEEVRADAYAARASASTLPTTARNPWIYQYDIEKAFLEAVQLVTDVDCIELITQVPNQQERATLYAELANKLGLQNTLYLALLKLDQPIEETSFSRIARHLGEPKTIIANLYRALPPKTRQDIRQKAHPPFS